MASSAAQPSLGGGPNAAAGGGSCSQRLLVGLQHRGRRRVWARLEQWAGRRGVRRRGLQAVHSRRPPALQRIKEPVQGLVTTEGVSRIKHSRWLKAGLPGLMRAKFAGDERCSFCIRSLHQDVTVYDHRLNDTRIAAVPD